MFKRFKIVLCGIVFANNLFAQPGVGPAPYCLPTYWNIPCNSPGASNAIGNGVNDFIDNFNTTGAVTNITTNGTGCNSQLIGGIMENYINYTCPTHIRVNPGQAVNCNFLSGITYGQGFAVYVDWNKDCVFDFATEQVCAPPGVPAPATPTNASFVVPAFMANGAYKFRVRCAFATSGPFVDPCTQYSFGETHDYVLYIGSNCNVGLPVCTVLPVEMVYFNALALENSAEVVWGTANESNNSYFTIERSFDLENFTLIEKVKGAGNSHSSKNYNIIDPEPNKNGTTYYRIKQFDYDGTLGHSEVITLNMNQRPSGLKLNPNPAFNVLNITLPQSLNGNILSIELTDFKGSKIKVNQDFKNLSLDKTFDLNLSEIPKGVYFITIISDNGKLITDKFIKN